MESIKSESSSVGDLFQKENKYVIPPFQRPYSWDEEDSVTLLEDLEEFFDEENNEEYFLGNLVVYLDENGKNEYRVVDGQQRLTTLSLLLKVFYDGVKKDKDLEENGRKQQLEKLIHLCDSRDKLIENSFRLESKILGEKEKENLKAVLSNRNLSSELNPSSRYGKNYEALRKEFEKWRENRSKDVDRFIGTIIDKVRVLVIRCGSQDQSLTVFQTLNDRGLPLSDADIFKATLYEKATREGKEDDFIERWDALLEKGSIDRYFTYYMHLLNTIENKEKSKKLFNDKVPGIRNFFNEKEEKRLDDWEKVLGALEKFSAINDYLEEKSKIGITMWQRILREHKSNLWQILLYIFMYERGSVLEEEGYVPENEQDLSRFLKSLASLFARMALKGWYAPRIRSRVIQEYFNFYKKEGFLSFSKPNEPTQGALESSDEESAVSRMKNSLKFFLLIKTYLTSGQNETELFKREKQLEIEHILPRKWAGQENWSKDDLKKYYDRLGNLVLLEKKANIKAGNNFFGLKKEQYKESSIQDAKNLCKKNSWGKEEIEAREEEIKNTVLDFIKNY